MTRDLDSPHRRRNALSGEWVLVSPQRMGRPWQGQQDAAPQPPPVTHDPACYLCAGNVRVGGHVNPGYAGVHVFDNDFPALLAGSPAWRDADPLFGAAAAAGTNRVIVFSPDHGMTLARMAQPGVRAVVDAWCDQSRELGSRYASVQLFENKGTMMGASNPHPHGQVWATAHVPGVVAAEDRTQHDYRAAHGTAMLLDLAAREIERAERVVAVNDDWLGIVPWWASWPFELLLLPRFAVARMPDLIPSQRDGLAAILRDLLGRYDALFGISFPYSMGWHGAPFGTGDTAHWQLHAHFYPPLLRSATVRKFMVGYEMMAEAQRDLTPERAAAMLREAR